MAYGNAQNAGFGIRIDFAKAHVYDIGVQVHCCGSPISAAVTFQLEAVILNFVIHELHASALIQDNINLCKYDYAARDGYFETPELPGIWPGTH